MGNYNRITGYVLIALVTLALFMQVKLYITFLQNKKSLDADPLVFGANKYGIDACECHISNTTKIVFTKNESKTIVTRKGNNYNFPLNISILNGAV